MYLIVSNTLIVLSVSGQPQPVILVLRQSEEWVSSQMKSIAHAVMRQKRALIKARVSVRLNWTAPNIRGVTRFLPAQYYIENALAQS